MTTIRLALDTALDLVTVAVFGAALLSLAGLAAVLFNLTSFGDPWSLKLLELL